VRSPRASVRGAVADGKAQRSLALASPVRRGEAGGWRRDGAVIESGHSSGIVIVGKAKTMGRNHISKLARRILAVGIVSCFPGCGSFEPASPDPHLGWSKEGLKERITPAQEADVQIALGRSAEYQGDIGSAEVAYRQALKRDKKRGDAHLHLANIQTLKGQYRQAEEEYQKAWRPAPETPTSSATWATVHQASNCSNDASLGVTTDQSQESPGNREHDHASEHSRSKFDEPSGP
jgi:tetratricopeptide (TPR) repeat protein